MGTGLVYLNNLGQMVRALHGHSSAAVYVSIFSVSSCAGRLLLGCAPIHVLLRAMHADMRTSEDTEDMHAANMSCRKVMLW